MTEGENRVLVDLPLRLQKAQAAVFALEQAHRELHEKFREKESEADRYRKALEQIHQSGKGKHVEVAREALNQP